MDGHNVLLIIDSGGIAVHATCLYAYDDPNRPCWPQDLDTDPPRPAPAPQTSCVYVDWIEAEQTEIIDVPTRVMTRVANARWDNGFLQLTLEQKDPDGD